MIVMSKKKKSKEAGLPFEKAVDRLQRARLTDSTNKQHDAERESRRLIGEDGEETDM